MENIIKAGRIFYAAALLVYGVQQFMYADFRPVFVPAWQTKLPALSIWAYVFGAWLLVTAVSIIIDKKAKELSLILGFILLLLLCFVHIPYELVADQHNHHLGSWTNALKELALAGGAFVVAGTFINKGHHVTAGTINFLQKLTPAGKVFFSITMTCFGIDHFLYTALISQLVPAWIPFKIGWTQFAGAALIGSGLAIIFGIKVKLIATLLGIMISLWLIVLHIPRAIAAPYTERGNELSSAFDALAFSGIAFIIALSPKHKH